MAVESRPIQVCDRIVERLAALMPDSTEVAQAFAPEWDVRNMSGRHIWVMPGPVTEEDLDRAAAQVTHRIAATVAYKFDDVPLSTDTEPVPVASVREQLFWVERNVWDVLRERRKEIREPLIPGGRPVSAEWEVLYDQEQLVENKVLWCEIVVEYRLIVERE